MPPHPPPARSEDNNGGNFVGARVSQAVAADLGALNTHTYSMCGPRPAAGAAPRGAAPCRGAAAALRGVHPRCPLLPSRRFTDRNGLTRYVHPEHPGSEMNGALGRPWPCP